MKNKKGFSVVELIVAVAFIGVAGIFLFSLVAGGLGGISVGINGISETRCIDGFKFIVGEGGQSRQVLNEQGGGIRCQ